MHHKRVGFVSVAYFRRWTGMSSVYDQSILLYSSDYVGKNDCWAIFPSTVRFIWGKSHLAVLVGSLLGHLCFVPGNDSTSRCEMKTLVAGFFSFLKRRIVEEYRRLVVM